MSKEIDSKETGNNGLYTLLCAVASLKDLPKDLYKIDVWDEGKTFISIDTETDIVEYAQMVKLPCGCCHDYEQMESKFASLYPNEQFAILEDMVDRYCT
jgi:hypothetical protein